MLKPQNVTRPVVTELTWFIVRYNVTQLHFLNVLYMLQSLCEDCAVANEIDYEIELKSLNQHFMKIQVTTDKFATPRKICDISEAL